jgi:hypothetical protein
METEIAFSLPACRPNPRKDTFHSGPLMASSDWICKAICHFWKCLQWPVECEESSTRANALRTKSLYQKRPLTSKNVFKYSDFVFTLSECLDINLFPFDW